MTKHLISPVKQAINKALEVPNPYVLDDNKGKFNVKTVTVSDFHIPFIDDDVFDIFLDFLKDYQPDELILNGNIVNMTVFSQHPVKKSLINVLIKGQTEVEEWMRYAKRLREALPNASIKYIGSTCHEGWLERWAEIDSTLAADENYRLDRFLHFDQFDIEYYPEKYEKKHFMWVHGSNLSEHSAQSAKKEFEYYGKSGCSGHCHRLGAYYKTFVNEPHVWYEVGCLCIRKSWYKIKGKNLINWQQGFLVNEFYGNAFSGHLVAIVRDDNDKPFFIQNGVIYK